VKQPVGSQSVFLPSFLAADPTFEVNVAGTYEFQLDVWDQNDQKSLTSAFVTVAVIPDEAIHVELLWTTEGDPDQTDAGPEAGVDLDLHFAHPFAITTAPTSTAMARQTLGSISRTIASGSTPTPTGAV
jgi:hypothetical protein